MYAHQTSLYLNLFDTAFGLSNLPQLRLSLTDSLKTEAGQGGLFLFTCFSIAVQEFTTGTET